MLYIKVWYHFLQIGDIQVMRASYQQAYATEISLCSIFWEAVYIKDEAC